MNLFQSKSLQFKLLGIFAGLMLVPAAVNLFVLNRVNKQVAEKDEKNFSNFSNVIEDAIAAQYFERYGDVQAFAMNPTFQKANKSDMVSVLNNYVALYGIYDLVMFVDTQGKLLAVNDKGPDSKSLSVKSLYEKSYSSEEWFTKTMSGSFTSQKEKNFDGSYVEDPYFDSHVAEVYGSKSFGNTFNAPVKDSSGKVIGILSNRAGFRWIEAEFTNAYKKFKDLGISSIGFELIDSKGYSLVSYNPKSDNANEEVVHNPEKLKKFNFLNSGFEAAKHALEGKEGFVIQDNPLSQIPEVMGYTVIRTPKIVDSHNWAVIVHAKLDEVLAETREATSIFWISLSLLCFFGLGIGVWFSRDLSRSVSEIVARLSQEAEKVQSSSTQVESRSSELSAATTQQAAAIQQTAASVDEISAMVNKNAETALNSQKKSAESEALASEGRDLVDKMMRSIEDISQSSDQIAARMEQSNKELSEIVNVISEIGNKTKVINDIVFQTKLLSFNASVEAARAGEHGKGFAVVAEEVGNLAAMSGAAAKEIGSMLDQSISKVQRIVENSTREVTQLMSSSKQKVNVGSQTAHRCHKALEEILSTAKTVNQLVADIASASHEQATGVQEITKAMQEMDSVTQKNASVASDTKHLSLELNEQSESMRNAVSDLQKLVTGISNAVENLEYQQFDASPKAQSLGARKIVEQAQKSKNSSSHPARPGNVLKLNSKKSFKSANSDASSSTLKKAVGDGVSVPSENDPRFEDV